MKLMLPILAFWGAFVGTVQAQESYCEVNCVAKFKQPVTVFTEQTTGAGQYRLILNGQFTNQTYALVNGNVEFTFGQGFSVGTYTFVIEAVGPDWVSPTDPGTLTVVRNRVRFK